MNSSEKHVLLLISQKDGVSRKELAELSNLSQATITNITKGLIDRHYIVEGDHVGQGLGRKEVLLYSNPDKFHYLGIDIGGYSIRVALSDNNMNVLKEAEWRTADIAKEADKCEAMIQRIGSLLNCTAMPVPDAIGIGVTGIVDAPQRTILNIPNAECWNRIELADALQQHYSCPVFLDEGGRTIALAEKVAGDAKALSDFIVVHIGYGLVAGIMINETLLRGVNNAAGLMGHVTVNENGLRCLCGNYGCLENIVTFPMLEHEYRGRGGLAASIIDAYHTKDKIALDVCVYAGSSLGIALSNAVNLLNPQAIYLGGAMFEHMPMLFEETKRTLMLRANRFATTSLSMKNSTFGDKEGIMGAICLAKTRFISDYE